MTTKNSLGLSEQLKFLNSTVISFDMSLGLGSSAESTLTVDLVDDCNINQQFYPVSQPNSYGVGMPVYFPDNPIAMPNCSFGGILANWTIKKSSSGLTYNALIKDPRQLLENTLIVIDSLITGPKYHINYYNVYAYWEQDVIYSANCNNYGLSQSNVKGMPYYKIVETLNTMDINIYPSTYTRYPYFYKIDFSTFPGIVPGSRTLPSWYRVPGPGISILQLLEDICNTLAYEFYIYLERNGNENVIKIGLIDLNNPPTNFNNIFTTFASSATDISYGQELRNEKSKMVILGDSVHYLMPTNVTEFFFGEDDYNGNLIPIIPYYYDDCGFWINKKIDSLNLSLSNPFPSSGPYSLSELDIRCAMASYEIWSARVFDTATPGTFNAVIRAMYPNGITNIGNVLQTFQNINSSLNNTVSVGKNLSDGLTNPSSSSAFRNQIDVVAELKKIHDFVSNLGSTYYGKQFITRLDSQKICKKYDEESNTYIYSDTPTNNGAWIDYSQDGILGLNEPQLSHFRTDDNRLVGFAQFALTYAPNIINPIIENNNSSVRSTDFSTLSDSNS